MFDKAVEIILDFEGGYSNDPNDPGGETNFGISKRAHPHLDIKNLTVDMAKAIYKKEYWDKANCAALPNKLALCYFDCCVNQGEGRAIRLLNNCIPKNQTKRKPYALMNQAEEEQLVIKFMAERARHYASLETFPIYGKGWMRRLFRVTLEASRM